MAAWGGYGVTAPQGRRGSSTAHGGGGGAPALGGTKARPQAWERGKGNDAKEGKAAGRLTLGRRCSRRRLDEEGEAGQTYTAVLCFPCGYGLPPDADVPLPAR
jgi:hypothetical protein